MSEQSHGQLAGVGDVTHYMWPTYKRQTAAEGGDISAQWQFGGDDALLEQWFYEYLGREFREHFGGQTTFLGRVHTMRLAYNRLSLTVSLDWLFNRVACAYTSVLDGSTLYTDFVEDAASIAQWGARAYIIRPTDNTIGLSEAEELAQDFLAEFAQPQVSRSEVGRLDVAQLQITAQGYAQALGVQLIREEVEGEDDADAEVLVALTGASLVTAGAIATNTRQVSIQFDWQSRLDRLAWLAGRRDALGRRYVYGTFGSAAFDYQPAADSARYHIWTKRPVVEHFTPGKDYVPAPLVMPGGYSLVADQQTRTAGGWNPARQWDASVVYDRDGASLRGGAWGVQERTAALQMALTARRLD
ncbi:MAG: hypothetical protein H6661_10065 [Ardenticatenaceae bacterium]|nr:hypothetical protein [Ardenticatenaceae bacterium]